jgi:ABC-type dipeptide/oligopeptide/nickel transport system permease subunit
MFPDLPAAAHPDGDHDDKKYDQSIMIVILILGLTGWTGLARIVRGETLKQRAFPTS